ncbi:MAG: Ni/Fe-hydrogenase cytochrome b subunit [Peptococcaceae bacterium]|nr:Ni/Fe-hydrogenase cytochrome b subunit [Peptococcaceae bacterium]
MQEETARGKWGFRFTPVRLVMLGIAVAAIVIVLVRLVVGLGGVTNLNDQWPWGLWIYFDVLLGVALAGGGYSTAFIVHVLKVDKYHSIARSAMLTSLLGYLLVVLGLFIDVGQWFNAWRPFVSWGHHSVLFEVFLCVSLYLIVQFLEFGEIASEKIFKRTHKFFLTSMPILLIIGVMLPTLHQSSLGELFFIMQGKLDPLWLSPIIPICFLLTSFAVGPAMIAIETRLASRPLHHKPDLPVLKGLIKISGGILLIYFVIKMIDLGVRGQFGNMFAGTFASNMFLLEIGAGVLIPILLAFSRAVATNAGQIWFACLTVGGVVLSRFNMMTGLGGYLNASGAHYFPSVMEFIVSIGFVCIACLLYLFIAENFVIVDDHAQGHEVELKEDVGVPAQQVTMDN